VTSKITGYRTILFNVIAILVVIFGKDKVDAWFPFTPEQVDLVITVLIAGGNIGLRAVTSTPIFNKPQ
jgi:hypothetical protein